MTRPNDHEAMTLAEHLDRVRRAQAPMRHGTVIRPVPGGWVSVRKCLAPGEFPSDSANRVYWMTARVAVTAAAVDAARGTLRELGCARAFVWLSPWGWSRTVEKELAAAGATEWTGVEYLALARPMEDVPAAPTALAVREVRGEEAAGVLACVEPWYGADGAASGARIVTHGLASLFAAFADAEPVAVGLLTVDGAWAHLSAAGTAPGFRGRGAQSALIAARLARAAAAGAGWCAVEAHTAAGPSLRNLERAGFVRALRWRVFRWDLC